MLQDHIKLLIYYQVYSRRSLKCCAMS